VDLAFGIELHHLIHQPNMMAHTLVQNHLQQQLKMLHNMLAKMLHNMLAKMLHNMLAKMLHNMLAKMLHNMLAKMLHKLDEGG
jgi:hypothetical protein